MGQPEQVRRVIDDILRLQPDKEEGRYGFVHLYGVATLCALLALKRGLDPQLCTVAGMLHDIWAYKTGNPAEHAHLGTIEAERILTETGCFTEKEESLICGAISNHSRKGEIHGPMDELLKDADVLHHYLYNTSAKVDQAEEPRLVRALGELGIEHPQE